MLVGINKTAILKLNRGDKCDEKRLEAVDWSQMVILFLYE